MNLKQKLIIFLWILVMPLAVHGQTVTIEGNVTDENNTPLPGVNVSVKGTSVGTITDANGKYSLDVPEERKTLVFSFVGMLTREIPVENKTRIDVQLKPDLMGLEEIVVIGYGTIKKKDLTGSIQTLSGEELVNSRNTNVTESLNGRISGVLVSKSSNRPGAAMSVEIRGVNSINFSNEPLYVIDGVPSYSGMIHLNPNDIESIDVLKDASSSAIYGSRGANGVVIVTTKGANTRKGLNLEYSGNVGIKVPTRIPDMIGNLGNGYDYVQYRIALWKKKYGDASLSRPDFLTEAEKERIKNGEYYDWLREVSNPGLITNHTISSSGGSDHSSYSFGLGYTKDEGLVGLQDFERITANVRLEHRFSDKIKTGISSYISNNATNFGAREALMNAYFIPPIVSPYDENNELSFIVQPTSSKINPLYQAENNLQESQAFFSNFNGFIEAQPVESLKLKSMVAYQYNNDLYGEWVGQYTQQKMGVNPNEAFRREAINNNLVWDNIATFDKQLGDNHHFNAIGLFSMQKDTHRGSQMRGEDLPYDSYWHAIQTAADVRDVRSYYWESSMISYMLRANYTILDKYMLTLTGRYDGTSRLQSDRQWGFMPSVAFGWQLNEEDFLSNVDVLDNLRLRLSYGKSGNNNIGHDITWTKLALSRYTFGTDGVNGFGIGNEKGNTNLGWEMTSEVNVGIDYALFNSRISGTVDLYERITDGLILRRAISAVNGYNAVFQNIGTTMNRGVELGMQTVNVSRTDFSWRTNLTFSLNRNQIVDLYGDNQDDLGNRWFIGEPIRVIYDFKHLGIWQEEEVDEASEYGQSVGHIKVEDVDGNYALDEQDYQVLGAPMPDWTAGMINTVNYRNFDLSVDVYARVGGLYNDEFTYVFTAWDNEHWNKLDVEYWTPENRSNKFQQVGAVSYYTQVLGKVPGTFLKVRNITLGYQLDKDLIANIGNARCYISVQNPFTFTNYLGSDPEIIGENINSQLSLYPMTLMFGLDIQF